MKYKQLSLQKVESVEQLLSRAVTAVNQNNRQVFEDSVDKLKERLTELRQMIDMEQEG